MNAFGRNLNIEDANTLFSLAVNVESKIIAMKRKRGLKDKSNAQ